MQALKSTDASLERARKVGSVISIIFACMGLLLIFWTTYQVHISNFRVFDSSSFGFGIAFIIFSFAARTTGNTIGDASLGRARKAGAIICTFFICIGLFLIFWTLYHGFMSSFRVFDSSLFGLGVALIFFSAATRNIGNIVGDASLGRARKAGSSISTIFSYTGTFLVVCALYQGFLVAFYQGFISSFQIFESSSVGLGLALIIFSFAARTIGDTVEASALGRARKGSSIISTIFSCMGIFLVFWVIYLGILRAVYLGLISSFRIFDSSLFEVGVALIIFSVTARNIGNTIGVATLGRARKVGSIISTFFSSTGIFLIVWALYHGFLRAVYQGFVSSVQIFDSSSVELGLALIIFSFTAPTIGDTIEAAALGRTSKAGSIISTFFSGTGIFLIVWALYQGFIRAVYQGFLSSVQIFDSSSVGLGLAVIIFSFAARTTGDTMEAATLGRARKAGSTISTFFRCTGIFLIVWALYHGFLVALYQGFVSSVQIFDSSSVGLGLALIIFSFTARTTGDTIEAAALGRARKAGSIISTFFSSTGIFLIVWALYHGFIRAVYQGFLSSVQIFDSSSVGLGLAVIIFSFAARTTGDTMEAATLGRARKAGFIISTFFRCTGIFLIVWALYQGFIRTVYQGFLSSAQIFDSSSIRLGLALIIFSFAARTIGNTIGDASLGRARKAGSIISTFFSSTGIFLIFLAVYHGFMSSFRLFDSSSFIFGVVLLIFSAAAHNFGNTIEKASWSNARKAGSITSTLFICTGSFLVFWTIYYGLLNRFRDFDSFLFIFGVVLLIFSASAHIIILTIGVITNKLKSRSLERESLDIYRSVDVQKPSETVTSISNIEEVGKYAECPYCGFNIRKTFYELGGVVRCNKCGVFHHKECFDYYGGKCGSLSCTLKNA
jgi:hypothetical protein